MLTLIILGGVILVFLIAIIAAKIANKQENVKKEYTMNEIYKVFREYKEEQGKDGSYETFKTTYLYKGLSK